MIHHWIIPAIKFVGGAVAALVIFKWIERRILLAWLGVKSGDPQDPIDRVMLRFEKLRTSVWMFAWLKVRLDPQFRELPEILKTLPQPKTILDVGCGRGIVGGALLEWCPGAVIVGIDSRESRIRSATTILGGRGLALCSAAPNLPMSSFPPNFDLVVLLDVIHYLSDADLELTLQRVRQCIADSGTLILRDSIAEAPHKSFFYYAEQVERMLTGARVYYRTNERIEKMLQSAGFALQTRQKSGNREELYWFILKPADHASAHTSKKLKYCQGYS